MELMITSSERDSPLTCMSTLLMFVFASNGPRAAHCGRPYPERFHRTKVVRCKINARGSEMQSRAGCPEIRAVVRADLGNKNRRQRCQKMRESEQDILPHPAKFCYPEDITACPLTSFFLIMLRTRPTHTRGGIQECGMIGPWIEVANVTQQNHSKALFLHVHRTSHITILQQSPLAAPLLASKMLASIHQCLPFQHRP